MHTRWYTYRSWGIVETRFNALTQQCSFDGQMVQCYTCLYMNEVGASRLVEACRIHRSWLPAWKRGKTRTQTDVFPHIFRLVTENGVSSSVYEYVSVASTYMIRNRHRRSFRRLQLVGMLCMLILHIMMIQLCKPWASVIHQKPLNQLISESINQSIN